jgi:hypothetical protein
MAPICPEIGLYYRVKTQSAHQGQVEEMIGWTRLKKVLHCFEDAQTRSLHNQSFWTSSLLLATKPVAVERTPPTSKKTSTSPTAGAGLGYREYRNVDFEHCRYRVPDYSQSTEDEYEVADRKLAGQLTRAILVLGKLLADSCIHPLENVVMDKLTMHHNYMTNKILEKGAVRGL